MSRPEGEDPAFLEFLPLEHADWVVTSLPQWKTNRAFRHALGHAGFKGKATGVISDGQHGRALDAAGATRVLNPNTDAADFAALTLLEQLRLEAASRARETHTITP